MPNPFPLTSLASFLLSPGLVLLAPLHCYVQVADTVSSISHYSAPLYPYLDSASSKLSPVLDSGYSSLKTGMEKRLPEGVNDTITHVKVQVG